MLRRKIGFSCIVLLFFLFFTGFLYAADGLIERVAYSEKNGKTESVIFQLNGPWLPKVFALKGEKPRVVFDFKETRLARSVPSSIDAKGQMIRKIRMGRHADKTRVVIDLVAGGAFNFDQQFDEDNNILTIQLFSGEVLPKEEVVVPEVEQEIVDIPEPELVVIKKETVVAEIATPEPEQEIVEPVTAVEEIETVEVAEPALEIKNETEPEENPDPIDDALLVDVSFENTSNKGEMVLFKLNGFYPPTVSGKEEGAPLVICDFAGTRLGEKVVKEQAIHGEYVERMSVEQIDDSNLIRVTLELVPNKDYDLQQVFFKEDDLFVIIVNSYSSSNQEAE
jgi:hypothetical protein